MFRFRRHGARRSAGGDAPAPPAHCGAPSHAGQTKIDRRLSGHAAYADLEQSGFISRWQPCMALLGLSIDSLALFALASFLLAATPGPVWLYLISRTLAQGRRAGYFSMFGVAAGLALHAVFAALGLTVVLLAVPFAFDAIKLAGAAYLLWLAFNTLRGAGFSFTPQPLQPVPPAVLLRQAFVAAVVNPKVAVFYLSLFPQFVQPASGPVLGQGLLLATVQIAIAVTVDMTLVTIAGVLAGWFARRPAWLRLQRWFLGSAFGVLAVWLALTPRHATP
jgi:threonine/homoserine/homoserine lactone efflux protein